MMVTLLDDSVEWVFFMIIETFHPSIMSVVRDKENETSSEIMHLFTGMSLYVKDDPPFFICILISNS